MAQNIEIKHSAIPGKVPTTSSLHLGQLAVNSWDGKVYFEKFANTSDEVLELVSNKFSGSVAMSGSLTLNGYIRLDPVTTNIDTSISASYIYVSGSTNDLYFSQNGSGYANAIRLRWLESNLYTGILSGGVISSTIGSTTWNISSGSGIIVTQNASTGSAPFPTVQFVNWGNLTNIPITNSGSAKLTYVGIDSTGTPVQQIVPWGSTDINQFDTQITLGVVLHLSGSVSTGVFSSPQISYGLPQKADDFFRAFGPLKISGHTLQASGSTLSIKKTGGSAYKEGANYRFNANHPSTTVENDINVSKIYRYYISGSTPVIDTGTGAAGYTVIDPTQRVNTATGALTGVSNNKYSIQRVFWIPNSPTNAFIVYYGNAQYDSLVDAASSINTEPFIEAPNTAVNGIFVGWILVAGGASSLTNASDATIIQGGIFRNVGGIGSSGTSPLSNTLAGLSDVSIPGRVAGDLLYYNGSQWINSKSLTGNYSITGSLNVSSGITAATVTATSFTGSLSGSATSATSASYAATASFVANAVSSSFAATTSNISPAITNNTNNYVLTATGTGQINGESNLYFDGTNLGIGTTSPSNLLEVNGISAVVTPYGAFTALQASGSTGYRWTLANDASFRLQYTTNGFSGLAGTPLYVSSSGNIGIGTTTPSFGLDVSGTTRFNGNSQITGSLNISGSTSINGGGLIVSGTLATSGSTSQGLVAPLKFTTATANTNYTLVRTDEGKMVEMNYNVDGLLIVTIPLNSSVPYPIGTEISVIQIGAGTTVITGSSGVTVNSYLGYKTIGAQYGVASVVKRGTDSWYLFGNLS